MAYAKDIANADIPLIHAARAHEVLAEPTDLKDVFAVWEVGRPRRVVRRAVLMNSFINAAVKREVVFVTLEAGGGAENPAKTRELIDTRLDREVSHGLHFGGAEMDDFGILEWGIEIGRNNERHDESVIAGIDRV
jgi:hypothetical protein